MIVGEEGLVISPYDKGEEGLVIKTNRKLKILP